MALSFFSLEKNPCVYVESAHKIKAVDSMWKIYIITIISLVECWLCNFEITAVINSEMTSEVISEVMSELISEIATPSFRKLLRKNWQSNFSFISFTHFYYHIIWVYCPCQRILKSCMTIIFWLLKWQHNTTSWFAWCFYKLVDFILVMNSDSILHQSNGMKGHFIP